MGHRVALDATPLIGRPTGVGAFVDGVLPYLASQHDLDIRPYALTLRGFGDLNESLPPGIKSTQRLPMPAGSLIKMWARGERPSIEQWTGDVDVVHGTNFVVPPARHAARLVTVHDLTAVRYPELCTAETLRYPALIKRALDSGAHVQTPSEAVAAEVVELLGASREHVHAIHHGVNPPSAVVTGEPVVPDGMRYIVAVGTVEPRKNYPGLVRAFDVVAGEHSDVALVIVGNDGWGSEDLGAAIDGARNKERILRLGWVSADRRAAVIKDAAVLAFPSVYEGFGLPPLEAMQRDIPVVATDIPAVREVSGEAALLVAEGDDSALAGGLSSVLDDVAVGERLVAAGRKRVEQFTWERCAAGLADLYRTLAEERAS